MECGSTAPSLKSTRAAVGDAEGAPEFAKGCRPTTIPRHQSLITSHVHVPSVLHECLLIGRRESLGLEESVRL